MDKIIIQERFLRGQLHENVIFAKY